MKKAKTSARSPASATAPPRNDASPAGSCDPSNAGNAACAFADPVFILALPHSFSSVVCAMLGQHPQMYGLPETHLFTAQTLGQWWTRCSRPHWPMLHGLLRAIAQIHFGEQTEATVKLAAGWIKRRAHFTTGFLFEVLAQELRPSVLVEKSPRMVRHVAFMHRAHAMFPQARFIHLVRHPRSQGESLMKFLAASDAPGARRLLSELDDPQKSWYSLNTKVCEFLDSVPENQKLRIRGEDLLADPDTALPRIVEWLGLRSDPKAVEMMKHPEQSPFACLGPPGAEYGNDPSFLREPALGPMRLEPQRLDGPLSWQDDGRGFLPKVRQLAEQFGYE